MTKQIGDMFYSLEIIDSFDSYIWKSPKTGKVSHRKRWVCVCECGTLCIKDNSDLNHKTQCRSCGYAKRKQSTRRQSAYERLYKLHVVSRAEKTKGRINVEISVQDYEELCKQNCHYCDAKPNTKDVYSNKHAESEWVLHQGIDRKDNKIGYTKENSVPCCKNCNKAKSELSYNEFGKLIQQIYNHRFKK